MIDNLISTLSTGKPLAPLPVTDELMPSNLWGKPADARGRAGSDRASAALAPSALFETSIWRTKSPHVVHITASRNNTICTLTKSNGDTLCASSAGMCGLKKAARGTSDAGYQAVLALTEKAKQKNIEMPFGVHLRLAGFGPGREQAFRAMRAAGWRIVRISDYTSYRHAGCRPRKKRSL
ncbi:28S ribosomal protein S11, mitochondrial [Polyrhizophydium stewartii]|uniref:28S ribosomal protein S11, mitochondrial n=1 Tax=Polyrhizophydium stewartii TaxID=2732419 RepID=A0ABR4NFA9_9FUNG